MAVRILAVWGFPTKIPRGKAGVSRLSAAGYSAPRRNGGSEADFAKQSA